jgi:RNA-directed DNA polymerase
VGKHHSGRLGTGYKTIVKPSEEKVKLHYQKIADTITALNSAKQSDLISILNPIIRGWCIYYASVCSKEVFSDLKDMVQTRLFRWAKRRHPHKSWDWVSKRYWHNLDNDRWVFSTPSNQPNDPTCGNLHLIKHSWTPIVRHTKVKGEVSPYNGDWRYWSQRMGKYAGIPSTIATLMKKQKGKCSHCGLYFRDGDIQEIDHIIPKKLGGKSSYKNLQLLHRHCHHVKSASDGS